MDTGARDGIGAATNLSFFLVSALNRIHHFRTPIQFFVPILFYCFINNIFVLWVHYIFCLVNIRLL